MKQSTKKDVLKYAEMFAALGTEPRLQIMRFLLSVHPKGSVVGDIQSSLEMPASTLSHHLERLKSEDLVTVRREKTFLRYSANTKVLEELLTFLVVECCGRNRAVNPTNFVSLCKPKQ